MPSNHFIICHPLQFSSVQFSLSVMSNSLQPHGLQHARPPCPTSTPGIYLNSCPLSWWCHPTRSSSVVPFSSCLQSFPASGSFPVSQLFTSGGLPWWLGWQSLASVLETWVQPGDWESIEVSASTSVLSMNIQDWFPLVWTGWISVQFRELSRVFSNTTVQKYQFFGTQLSL